MNEKSFERWEKMRAKGMLRYMLINGLLVWGLPMFAVMIFFQLKPETGSILFGEVVVTAVLWAFAGLCLGYLT